MWFYLNEGDTLFYVSAEPQLFDVDNIEEL
jgi:hypothetical protein